MNKLAISSMSSKRELPKNNPPKLVLIFPVRTPPTKEQCIIVQTTIGAVKVISYQKNNRQSNATTKDRLTYSKTS